MIKLILFISLILQIWGVVDCLQSKKDANNKILWILVLVLLSYVGVVCYYLIGKKQN